MINIRRIVEKKDHHDQICARFENMKKKKCKPKIKHAELRPKSYGIAVPKDVLQENNIKRMNALLIEMLVWLIVKNT